MRSRSLTFSRDARTKALKPVPPRLVVGAVFGETPLALKLEQAGHSVYPIDPVEDPGAIQQVDLVLLDGVTDGVEWAAERLSPFARPQQMFLHTALTHGPQLLDDVETAHAIVMCAHNLFADVWVTSAADELGETVIGLLVSEIGGTSVPVNDADRGLLGAAQRLRALESTLRFDAYDLIRSALPDVDAMQAEFFSAQSGSAETTMTPQELDWLFGAIEDPGIRRLFVDVQRRQAEQTRSTDVELWAFSKYEGS